MKPSRIKEQQPFWSVFKNCEHETTAQNIAGFLSDNGDTFRPVSWDEYKAWLEIKRKWDWIGREEENERERFDRVAPYLETVESAAKLSGVWAVLLQGEKDDKP